MSDKTLPAHPSLDQIKKQAKELLQSIRREETDAVALFAKYRHARREEKFALHDAQLVLARQYGFPSWARLKEEVSAQEEKSALERFQSVMRAGEPNALRSLMKEQPGLRARLNDPLFDFGSPAIRVAVDKKNRELIDLLLAAGADINQRSEWEAGSFGVLDNVDVELGEFLISRGARVDIHSACGLGKLDEIERFLRKDPTLVNARGGDGGTPLHFAKNGAVAELLLARGADVTIRDRDHGSTAAMWQVHNREVLYRLIAAGAGVDIFMACVHGDLALAERAWQEDPACPSAVIGLGNFTSKTGGDIYRYIIVDGGRPLGVASHFNHRPLVEFLLSKTSVVDRIIFFGMRGDEASARELLGKYPGALETFGAAQLRCVPDAVFNGNRRGFATYLTLGFPITGHGADGGTALHIAAWKGEKEMVRELIRRGADLEDTHNIHGGTPLGWACHGSRYCNRKDADYPGVVAALLAAGADVTKPVSKSGESLLSWLGEGEIAGLLRRHRAR